MPSPFIQWTGIFVDRRVPGDLNFIKSLQKRLKQAGIDCPRHEITEHTSLSIAIPREMKFALVLFSKGYANSNRRLDELVEILRPDSYPVVIPIFYMDRAAVVGDGEFERALQTVDTNKKLAKEIEWRSALAKAEKISGGAVNESLSLERNLIDKIVGRLVNEMHSRYFREDFTFGPFGGEGQNDHTTDDIKGIDETGDLRKGIKVVYGDFIMSVAFQVDKDTDIKPQHGVIYQNRTYEVKLKEKEYITSFAGSKRKKKNNGVLISSLIFRTNKRILGPIGNEKEEEKKERKKEEEKKEEEEYFSVPLDAGEVIKFYWREKDNSLESVGALVRRHSKDFNPFKSEELFGRKSKHVSTWRMANGRNIFIRIVQKEGPSIQLSDSPFRKQGNNKTRGETGLGKEEESKIFKSLQDENLISISGYYTDNKSEPNADIYIRSLTFRTNKQMAVTFGEETGIYFSSLATAGKIVKFNWYTDEHQYLCGIGAYFEPICDHCPSRSIRPSEGSSGDTWDYRQFKGVGKVVVTHCSNNIHDIKFEYANDNIQNYIVTCSSCTAKGRPKKTPVDLKYPREYLTSVSGYIGEKGTISSLTFYSNKRRLSSEVHERGTYFWYPLAGSRIIDFYESKAPDYIGMHVEPIPHLYPFRIVGPPMKAMTHCGGKKWNDGVHTNVRGFRVATTEHRGKEIIKSITFMYDDNGSLVEGNQHGKGDASREDWDMLEFPQDRLLSIKGHMRKEDSQTFIYNLTILPTKSSAKLYAFGGSDKKWSSPGVPISIPEGDGRIVGFFGTAGYHLNSIGAWLEPY